MPQSDVKQSDMDQWLSVLAGRQAPNSVEEALAADLGRGLRQDCERGSDELGRRRLIQRLEREGLLASARGVPRSRQFAAAAMVLLTVMLGVFMTETGVRSPAPSVAERDEPDETPSPIAAADRSEALESRARTKAQVQARAQTQTQSESAARQPPPRPGQGLGPPVDDAVRVQASPTIVEVSVSALDMTLDEWRRELRQIEGLELTIVEDTRWLVAWRSAAAASALREALPDVPADSPISGDRSGDRGEIMLHLTGDMP